MKKVELLSPVGSMEMLYQAVHNGADAVYLAGKQYGARKFSNNFTNEELVEVIRYCHLYDVLVYVTVNTIIFEDEIVDLVKYIEFLYVQGVDAVIMQDIGMIKLVREKFPNLDVHASTQCHTYNEECVKLFRDLGCTRVVMAREMSLEQINRIKVDIEKEVFVYGALCVCYSGCCLFSSLNGGRSGNRGECVGSCRLPYKLLRNNEYIDIKDDYLLSTKELNTLNRLSEILDSGIDSLKIEGRMKSPYYVGYVTRLYRTLIDKYYNDEDLSLTTEEFYNLKKLFNREFTNGYLFHDDIMNIKSPNHQGVPIGKVVKVDKRYVYMKLESDNLYQEDGIRFKNSNKGMIINKLYNDKLLLVHSITKGHIAVIDNKFRLKKDDIVLKTIDKNLVRSLSDYEKKKIDVYFEVKAYIGKRLEIVICDNKNHQIIEYGEVVEEAVKREVTDSDIKRCICKLGNTPFRMHKIDIYKDQNIFINLRDINEVRRRLVDRLIEVRSSEKRDVIIHKDIDMNYYIKNDGKNSINVLVRNLEQLRCCLDSGVDNIYITDYDLYLQYKKLDNVYYRCKRVYNRYPDIQGEKLLVGELGSIYQYKDNNDLVGDYYLNVSNSYSIRYLNYLGVKRVTLSVEVSDRQIREIMKRDYNVELVIYGRLELMIMKYCPLKKCFRYCRECGNQKDKFYLEDMNKGIYPIISDDCLTHIMASKDLDKISKIFEYKKMGICNYRIELFDEDYEETKKIIQRVKNVL